MPIETIIKSVQSPEVQSRKVLEEKILAENEFFWRETGGVKILVSEVLEENGFVTVFRHESAAFHRFLENDLNLAGFNEDSQRKYFRKSPSFFECF